MTSLLKYYSIKGGQLNQVVESPGRLNKCSVFQEIAILHMEGSVSPLWLLFEHKLA